MNIEYVRLFIRIAALRNISAAGKELGLSAAVASTRMNKLENNLGVRLIHRTTRQVSLTEEGEAFLPHAASLLESVETARASIGSGVINPQGTLRVAAPASFGRMHVMPKLSAFMQRYPNLIVDMHLSDRVMDMVEGGFDIAIRNASLEDSGFVARKLAPDTRLLCASPEYIAQYGEPHTPEELVNHHCVNLMGLETWVFDTLNGPQSIKTANRFRTDNGEAVRDASISGLGITLSSTWCCYEQIKRGELLQVLKDYPLMSNAAIWAIYPSSRLLAPKVRVFIDYFSECFGGLPYWDEELG